MSAWRLPWLSALLVATASGAADLPAAEEDRALELADRTAPAPEQARDWRILAEGALGHASQRIGERSVAGARLSLGVYFDGSLAPGWRAVFGDRIDRRWQDQDPRTATVNTWSEGYLSRALSATAIVDAGRINVRNGVAVGYNPTDFFREQAVRFVVSPDPASLRTNRLGSVMVRGQTLWDAGSLTALYSPRLRDAPSNAPFSPDLGATNHENRVLLSVSERLAPALNPQFLLYASERLPLQAGVNATVLFGQATVAYAEWAGGRSPSLRQQALGGSDDTRFRQRASTGLTFTGPARTALTLEYQYNGAGLSAGDWSALQAGAPAQYLRYRRFAQDRQDPPTRSAWFLLASWQEALVTPLDLSGFLRRDNADGSHTWWLEARYHLDRTDVALQWQRNVGHSGSEYGALPQRSTLQLVLTHFF